MKKITNIFKKNDVNNLQFTKYLFLIIRDFSQWSTTDGFNHIFGSSNIYLVIFWIIVTSICTIFGIYQSFQLINVYLTYPVNTELIPRYEEIIFPAVTICEKSPYKNNKKNKYLNKIIDIFESKKNSSWGLYDIDDDNYLPYDEVLQFWLKIYSNELLDDDNINYKWNDNIVSCFYNHDKCDEDNFKIFKLPTFGRCFTLNYLGKWKVARSGNDYGLKITFKINENEILPFYLSYGAVMYIHSYQQYPFVELNPILLGTGSDISIGLSFSTVSKLPHPYGTCIKNDNNELDNIDNFYNDMYENEKCIRSCIQRKIIENCKCYYAGYAISDEFSSIKSCSEYIDENESKRNEIYQCIRKHIYPTFDNNEIKYFVNISSDCTCYEVCDRIFYEYSYASGKYPSSTYIPMDCRQSVLTDLKNNNITKPYGYSQEDCLIYYSENAISVEIFFEKLSYINSNEYAEYELIQLLYDVIGVLSFWIGISIITFLEIIIFIGTLLIFSLQFCLNYPKTKIKKREIRKNVGDDIKNDLNKLRKYPHRKDLYDKAAENDKMPPIQEG
ncbi:Na+ channel, amiloride-sensitive family-containing protein [Strongyloides ratti]|uniref:Na+ channel, amiloride-sensitive family-containing protein n=1 Tax=Strongyloides ratti TaxID=34506 RepID=A0A090LII7_STRRB|nr:Na+ channel, amiloride-sensitive family-containing protein [Strongyloides ratti]CEF69627.1 Na+ channel, amiloride-sensitive family-containing protein [Strongyloides ratti]